MSEPTNNLASPPSTTRPTLSSSVVSFTWLLLCIGTVLSWWLSSGSNSADPLTNRSGEQFAIIALATFKMYLVVAVFMGLIKAPLFWHIYTTLLLLLMGGFMLLFTVAL